MIFTSTRKKHSESPWYEPITPYNSRMLTGIKINPRMRTGIDDHAIPVCIWGSRSIPVCIQGYQRSPYAHGNHMTHNPRMHTGYGDQDKSPYAYGDHRDPCFHMGIT